MVLIFPRDTHIYIDTCTTIYMHNYIHIQNRSVYKHAYICIYCLQIISIYRGSENTRADASVHTCIPEQSLNVTVFFANRSFKCNFPSVKLCNCEIPAPQKTAAKSLECQCDTSTYESTKVRASTCKSLGCQCDTSTHKSSKVCASTCKCFGCHESSRVLHQLHVFSKQI
jgi:hypothetical protein